MKKVESEKRKAENEARRQQGRARDQKEREAREESGLSILSVKRGTSLPCKVQVHGETVGLRFFVLFSISLSSLS